MNCTAFLEATAAECHTIRSLHGDEFVYVPMASTFEDGEPLSVYVMEVAGVICFTDFGDSLLHLQRNGFAMLGDRRRRRSLAETVKQFGCVLNDDGEVVLFAHDMPVREAMERFSAAMKAIATWEVENSRLPVDAAMLVDEVREYLERASPGIRLRSEVPVTGISGRQYIFPLATDDTLIDVTTSHHNAVSALVRKLVDVRAVPSNTMQNIDVYLDDRDTLKSAEDEKLLTVLARPHRMSAIRQLGRATSDAHDGSSATRH